MSEDRPSEQQTIRAADQQNSSFKSTTAILLYCSIFLTSNVYALRIVSLAPSHTEILFELGLEKEIVGVTNFCNYPPAALKKEKVGDAINPDIERIILLKPDLIVSLTDNRTTKKLKRLGFNVAIKNPQSIKEIIDAIAELGKLTGRGESAARLIAELNKIIAEVKSASRSEIKPRICIEIFYPPLWSCSRSSFVGEIVELMSYENVFAEVKKDYFPVSVEAVIKREPEIYMVLSGEKNIEKRTGFRRITAVRRGKIFYAGEGKRDILVRPSPRMIRAIPALKKNLQKLYAQN